MASKATGPEKHGQRDGATQKSGAASAIELLEADHREVGVEARAHVDRSIQNSHQTILHPSGDDRRRRRLSGVQVER